MITLAICVLLAVFGAVQTIRIGDLKAKLRMPELPPKRAPKSKARPRGKQR